LKCRSRTLDWASLRLWVWNVSENLRGGKKKRIAPSVSRPTRSTLTEDSNLNSEDEIIIKSIAVEERKTIDVLRIDEDTVGIVQEYAHGGISILKEKFGQYGSFVKYVEKEIEEQYKEWVRE
jgi:hypothetical protein